eukprot:TRINITY_DN1386_c0_g1_i1.p1 TRINITY_DN1386_c0_g1~~TRINITY_DN1386_c0_g1_i1.p1  ORF type:complete len:399 (-),score=28.25 TRINITY_DN1386_c0_g1_i1:380-1576(-)
MAPALALFWSVLVSAAAAESCKENDALCKESSSDGFQHLVQVQVAKKENSEKNAVQGDKLMHQEHPNCGEWGQNAYHDGYTGRYHCCVGTGLRPTWCGGKGSEPICVSPGGGCDVACAPNGADAWNPPSRGGRCCSGMATTNCDGTLVCLSGGQSCPHWTKPSAATTTMATENPYCAPNGGNAWWPSSRAGKCCDGGSTTNCDGTLFCLSSGQPCPAWAAPTTTTTTENPYCAPDGGNAWWPTSRAGKCCHGGATTNCDGTLFCLSSGQPCPAWAAPTTTTTTENPYCAPDGGNAWWPTSRAGKCCHGGATTNCDGTLLCLSWGQSCPGWVAPTSPATTVNGDCAQPGENAWYPSSRAGKCCNGGPTTNCDGTLVCLFPGQACPYWTSPSAPPSTTGK